MLQKVIDELGIDINSRRSDYRARTVLRYFQTVETDKVTEKITAHQVQRAWRWARENKDNPLPGFEEIVKTLTPENKVLATIFG